MPSSDAVPRQLPIGIQTFADIRRQGCYYVDKTAKILELIDNGKSYFLSRPRRFGKSLLVDTIKELFEGNEALFEDLHAHGHWDWGDRHPVVRLDLSGSFRTRKELDRQAIRDWYNGYNWCGEENVYNPYDVLQLLDRREFGAYWFEASAPAYVVNQIVERNISVTDLEDIATSAASLSSFELEDSATEALLFQSGYLTVRSVERNQRPPIYRLGYPNREVRLGVAERLEACRAR